MHIETRGSGPDLVMLHGWAMHGGIFAPFADALAAHFTLHVVDLPGHGFSHDDTGTLDPVECARRIAEAAPRAIWLGWSLGGLIALRAALDRPDRVR
ncbi:MAG: alpha/beta fold hydrolase, partial [Rhodanobacteraceae bacterium]